MNISYGITVCSELDEIKKLLKFLLQNKRDGDEVVITYDGYYLSHTEDRILIVISVDVRSGFTDEEIDSGGYEGDTDIYWIEKHFYGCSLNPSTFK